MPAASLEAEFRQAAFHCPDPDLAAAGRDQQQTPVGEFSVKNGQAGKQIVQALFGPHVRQEGDDRGAGRPLVQPTGQLPVGGEAVQKGLEMGMRHVAVPFFRKLVQRLHQLSSKNVKRENTCGRLVEGAVAGSPFADWGIKDGRVRFMHNDDRSQSAPRHQTHGPRVWTPQRQIGRHQQRLHPGSPCPAHRPAPTEQIGTEYAQGRESTALQGTKGGAVARERRPMDVGRQRVAVARDRADADVMTGVPQNDGYQVEGLGVGIEWIHPEYSHVRRDSNGWRHHRPAAKTVSPKMTALSGPATTSGSNVVISPSAS